MSQKKKEGRVVTLSQFLKKGLLGRVDTSGTKNAIKTGKLMTKFSKQGGRLDTSLPVEARHEHGFLGRGV